MSNNGWVKLHRKTLENIFLMRDNNAYTVFTKLLMLSNSKGQVGLSSRELAKTVNLSHSTLFKTLKRLERETLVEQQSKHSYTLITICNWSKYQEVGKHYGKHTGNAGETDGKRLTGVPRIENKNKESELGFEKPLANTKSFKTQYERLQAQKTNG